MSVGRPMGMLATLGFPGRVARRFETRLGTGNAGDNPAQAGTGAVPGRMLQSAWAWRPCTPGSPSATEMGFCAGLGIRSIRWGSR